MPLVLASTAVAMCMTSDPDMQPSRGGAIPFMVSSAIGAAMSGVLCRRLWSRLTSSVLHAPFVITVVGGMIGAVLLLSSQAVLDSDLSSPLSAFGIIVFALAFGIPFGAIYPFFMMTESAPTFLAWASGMLVAALLTRES